MSVPELSFRVGTRADADWLLGLFDGAVAWLEIVRVDCWAGAPSLVAWYEARGFVPSSRFTVNGDWTGQVFSLEL